MGMGMGKGVVALGAEHVRTESNRISCIAAATPLVSGVWCLVSVL
jgi:hypothetical protein